MHFCKNTAVTEPLQDLGFTKHCVTGFISCVQLLSIAEKGRRRTVYVFQQKDWGQIYIPEVHVQSSKSACLMEEICFTSCTKNGMRLIYLSVFCSLKCLDRLHLWAFSLYTLSPLYRYD